MRSATVTNQFAGAPSTTTRGSNGSAGRGLTASVVSTTGGFDGLEARWNGLLERSEATVFQSFEWQRTWWKYFGGSHRLRVLLFEEDGALVGIAPMFLSRGRLLGLPIARRLQFIGVGLSDYLQVIAARGREREVVEGLASWLAANRRDWDVFDLEDVPEKSPSYAHIAGALAGHGLRAIPYHGTVCPRFDLPGDVDGMMNKLGTSSSYNLKRKLNRLRGGFAHEFRVVRNPGDPIEQAMEQFSVIHGGRWKSQGHPSAFDDPRHVAFHLEVCRGFSRRGWLRVHFLDVAGTPAAVCFSFNYRNTIYMYQSNAHGDDEVMRCSPGLIVRWKAITDGIAEGMRVFDFMRGSEAYKYREWDATDERNWLIRSSSGTAYGRARFALFLFSELFGKGFDRLRTEYYDYRRYRLSGRDEEVPLPAYALERATKVFRLGRDFVLRHLPYSRATNDHDVKRK